MALVSFYSFKTVLSALFIIFYKFSGYLTGVTQSVWNVYEIIQNTMNINLNCPHFQVSQASNTSFDAIVSAFLTHTTSNTVGITASGAGAFMLQDSDATVNTTANENLWTAYGSQVFVNEASWKNFTSQGQSTEDPANAGSVAIPGTQPFEATVYSKLIDSNAEPGSETLENLDTVFLWGTEATFHNTRKRAGEVYGLVLSKTPNVGEDVFNKTLALLPPAIAQNNITVVLLQDSCEGAQNNQ